MKNDETLLNKTTVRLSLINYRIVQGAIKQITKQLKCKFCDNTALYVVIDIGSTCFYIYLHTSFCSPNCFLANSLLQKNKAFFGCYLIKLKDIINTFLYLGHEKIFYIVA